MFGRLGAGGRHDAQKCSDSNACILQAMDYAWFMVQVSKRRVWLFVGGGLVVALATLPCCTVTTPFAGAGYSKSKGVTLPDAPEHVVVGVTHALLHERFGGTFKEHTLRVLDSMETHNGAIGHAARFRLFGKEVWTVSVWRDEQGLNSFVRSPIHREAMRAGSPAMVSAQFLRFTWPAKDLPPPWSVVLDKLQQADVTDYAQAVTTERP